MKFLSALVLGATLSFGAAASPIDKYSGFIAFGDSLSDNGNVYTYLTEHPEVGILAPAIPPGSPAGPRYYDGQFSNGPVWADLFAAEFTSPVRPTANAAWGFSGAFPAPPFPFPNLAQQIADAAPSLPFFGPRPLASVWTGSNDVFRHVDSGGTTATPEAAAAAVIAGLSFLIELGVEDILAFTLPDLGLIPRFAFFQPSLAADATAATARFNTALLAGLPEVAGARVETVRVDLLFEDLVADPGAYGISDVDNPCVTPVPPIFTPFIPSPPVPAICADPSGYAFFDANHPSARLHEAIAREVEIALTPVPLPATLPLAGAGMAVLLAFRRRR